MFYQLFGCPTTNFGPLLREQPHSPNGNHYVFIIFLLKGHWERHNNKFLKTGDGLQTGP